MGNDGHHLFFFFFLAGTSCAGAKYDLGFPFDGEIVSMISPDGIMVL